MPALSATLFPSSPVRERKKEGERELERGRERERVTGALAPFSYLVKISI
jgi:hypothetical protein